MNTTEAKAETLEPLTPAERERYLTTPVSRRDDRWKDLHKRHVADYHRRRAAEQERSAQARKVAVERKEARRAAESAARNLGIAASVDMPYQTLTGDYRKENG